MQVLTVVLVLFQVAPDTSAQAQGWQGNLYLQNNQHQEAQAAYEQGLDVYRDGRTRDRIYYGLQNNLGLALHGQGAHEQAQAAFGGAAEVAEAAQRAEDASWARYNAGNSSFGAQANDTALEFYRQALLSNPQNEDARFNYEYVKRLQPPEQEQEQEPQDQEQQQDQGEQEQEQQQDQGQEQEQEQQEEEQQQDQPQDAPMSRAEAERILQALENEEKELMREMQEPKGRPRRVTKDW